jgi:hypothetical protein
MSQIIYFSIGTTQRAYIDAVYSGYLSNRISETDPRTNKDIIENTANALGLPSIKTAIAGAMAEENDSYLTQTGSLWNEVSDWLALHFVTVTDPIATLISGENWSDLITLPTYTNAEVRTHEQWVVSYNAAKALGLDVLGNNTIIDKALTTINKVEFPVLMDLGPGNFKMATAIRLIQENTSLLSSLGLSEYANQYDKLAQDLVSDSNGVSAKLYGLMIKEADDWFKVHNAYGQEWATLPQEIKDGLYVTYVNLRP